MCSSSVCWMRLDDRRRHAGHVLDGRLDLLGRLPQRVEVVAVDLDGDLGVDAGEHVADQVGQRLLDLDVDAGHFLAQLGRAAARGSRRGCRPLSGFMLRMYSLALTGVGVLVQLGAAGAADEVQDLAVGIRRPTSASRGTWRR